MNIGKRISAVVLFGCLVSTSALAGDAAAGKAKSASCVGCHGMTGISANPLWPNLAGQQEQYLVKQLQAFKAGERADPNMTALSSALSEQDIADIAAWFSSQACK